MARHVVCMLTAETGVVAAIVNLKLRSTIFDQQLVGNRQHLHRTGARCKKPLKVLSSTKLLASGFQLVAGASSHHMRHDKNGGHRNNNDQPQEEVRDRAILTRFENQQPESITGTPKGTKRVSFSVKFGNRTLHTTAFVGGEPTGNGHSATARTLESPTPPHGGVNGNDGVYDPQSREHQNTLRGGESMGGCDTRTQVASGTAGVERSPEGCLVLVSIG